MSDVYIVDCGVYAAVCDRFTLSCTSMNLDLVILVTRCLMRSGC
jgi:hypothetical protein